MTDLVVLALREPERLPALPPPQWDRLVRQARRADLLARIATTIADRGLDAHVPTPVRAHLEAARILSAARHAEVQREVGHLRRTLQPLGLPVVLLKGAAYVMAGLPAAAGRLFTDVDVMVPKHRLPEVEAALMLDGWASTHHSAYDQRYYREWMHELPPLRHVARGTVLDVHHAILPETARLKPSSRKLLDAVQPLPGQPGLALLSPPDMLLHSMVHLFHNDDLSHALRDLSDIDLLLRHHAATPEFWPLLFDRAAELDLGRPLHYGLQHARRVFDTPLPAAASNTLHDSAPPWPIDRLMQRLWSQVFDRAHLKAGGAPVSRFLLYIRAHWLRMPPLLLTRHLTVKAMRRNETETAP